MSKTNWWIWERPAQLHLIYSAANSATYPLMKEYGIAYTDKLYGFFKNGMVRWVCDNDVIIGNGKKMLDKFLDEGYYQQVEARRWEENERLFLTLKKIDSINLENLSNDELCKLYNEYDQAYIDWWGVVQVAELISYGGEAILKESLSEKQFKQYFGTLVTPTKKSYTNREEEQMFEIVRQAQNYGVDDSEVRRLLINHMRSYHWIQNNFATTTYLDQDYFYDVIKQQLGTDVDKLQQDGDSRLLEVKKQKEQILNEIEADDKLRRIVWLINEYCYLQDLRKSMDMEANWYTDLFCKEVARRFNTDYDLVKFATPVQVREIIESETVPKKQLKQQREHCVIIFNDQNYESEILIGQEAENFEQETFGEQRVLTEVNEIQGMSASVGRYTGTVRVCLSASDAKDLEPGEVLVTTMTSPDFVIAMKKAGAIITDEGGITCHAAVVSRELGLPCVIGTKIATRTLKTGDAVEIRANHGMIKVLNKV